MGVALAGSLALLDAGTARAGTLVITGPDGAEVSLDARPLGRLPLAGPLTLEPGQYVIRSRVRGYHPFEMPVSVTGAGSEAVVRISLEPYRRLDAVGRDLVFAGLGQHYLDRPALGWTLATMEATGLALGIGGEVSLRSRRDEFNDRYAAYQNAVAEADIVAAREAADASWRRVEDAASLRKAGVIVAVCAAGVGILDAVFRFPAPETAAAAKTAVGVDTGGGVGGPGGVRRPEIRFAWRMRF